MNTTHTLRITDATFADDVDHYHGLAMIDFGADWCAPCRILAPIVEQLAIEYDGRVKIGAVDVDANADTAARFGIRNLPTILFFSDGVHVDTVIGAVPRHVLQQKIDTLLSQRER